MTVAELPAPLTKGKRWAKNAAEREQQIQSEAIAIQVWHPKLCGDLLQCKTLAWQRGFRLCSLGQANHVRIAPGRFLSHLQASKA